MLPTKTKNIRWPLAAPLVQTRWCVVRPGVLGFCATYRPYSLQLQCVWRKAESGNNQQPTATNSKSNNNNNQPTTNNQQPGFANTNTAASCQFNQQPAASNTRPATALGPAASAFHRLCWLSHIKLRSDRPADLTKEFALV